MSAGRDVQKRSGGLQVKAVDLAGDVECAVAGAEGGAAGVFDEACALGVDADGAAWIFEADGCAGGGTGEGLSEEGGAVFLAGEGEGVLGEDEGPDGFVVGGICAKLDAAAESACERFGDVGPVFGEFCPKGDDTAGVRRGDGGAGADDDAVGAQAGEGGQGIESAEAIDQSFFEKVKQLAGGEGDVDGVLLVRGGLGLEPAADEVAGGAAVAEDADFEHAGGSAGIFFGCGGLGVEDDGEILGGGEEDGRHGNASDAGAEGEEDGHLRGEAGAVEFPVAEAAGEGGDAEFAGELDVEPLRCEITAGAGCQQGSGIEEAQVADAYCRFHYFEGRMVPGTRQYEWHLFC